MISIHQVTKKFKDHTALDTLSLEIPKGQIFALLGPNGAGKTTTISLLLGFLAPDSGMVKVAELDPYQEAAKARKLIGYIPENVNLYPQLSGLENIQYFTELAGASLTKDQFREYLIECGLQESAINRSVKTYSKGMRQKVGIAIAYAKQAKVLLLDEPASGLDPLASKELSQLIHRLSANGTTILMASHDLFRVKETADKIGIINRGKLIQSFDASAVSANDLEEIYLGTVI